ncbi:AAA family ATPase [Desulfurispora thermophila]|uniref:AAA family ATPase n=1 Tax=Desulfurispora thermophila TaxID=265470 RepID=UPI001A9911C2|nr:AAA family ATPase [Desulfurispora thermophila]
MATYDYKDANGQLLFQVVRYWPKTFRQRRPDPAANDGWCWSVKGIKQVPYKLPELLAALERGQTVFVVEGEKDADALARLDLMATCNAGGAGKWTQSHSQHFPAKARVVILPDNDNPGRKHAQLVASQLTTRGCQVKVIELPGLPEKGDVSDWLAAGGTKEQLLELVDNTAEWRLETKASSIIVRLADVEPVQVKWLWEPYIPLGKLTLLEGDPEAGKTWLALAIATAISNGRGLPGQDGRPGLAFEPGNVLYLTAEDGLADTLRPRLDILGADVKRVFSLSTGENGEFVTLADIETLDAVATQIKPKLIVIDPLQAYLGSNVDMHRANEVRPVLAKLAALAEKHLCAVLCIRHLSKAPTGRAIYRGMGSIDFTAAARSVLLAGVDPQNPHKRAVVQIKSSLASKGIALGYSLSPPFSWTGESELTKSDLLASEHEPEEKSALEEAESWLMLALESGPVSTKEIKKMAREAGISEATLRRAKEKLGVKAEAVYKMETSGRKKITTWNWYLPGSEPSPASEPEPPGDDIDTLPF